MEDYEFTHLTLAQRKQAIEERIAQYELRLFDCMMNAKAEAVSKNPHRERAVAELQAQMNELKTIIEMCRYESSMLDETVEKDAAVS